MSHNVMTIPGRSMLGRRRWRLTCATCLWSKATRKERLADMLSSEHVWINDPLAWHPGSLERAAEKYALAASRWSDSETPQVAWMLKGVAEDMKWLIEKQKLRG